MVGCTGQQSRHSRSLAEEVVAGEVVVVHDPEDELVLRAGRRRVDLELEHLVPARVPPLVCNTHKPAAQSSARAKVGRIFVIMHDLKRGDLAGRKRIYSGADLGRLCSCAPDSGTARSRRGRSSLQAGGGNANATHRQTRSIAV